MLITLLGMSACRESDNAILYQDLSEFVIPDSISILALGDSYTIGTSVSEPECWPNQLADSLSHRGLPLKEVRIIAGNGWTAQALLNAIKNIDMTSTYDLVGLLIGVNNQVQGGSRVEYERQFKELLQIAITLAEGTVNHVFVLSIPDYSVTPEGSAFGDSTISQEIKALNEINKKLTDQFSVQYFHITPLSETAASRPGLVAADGLHFSGKMYALWVEYIIEDLIFILTLKGNTY